MSYYIRSRPNATVTTSSPGRPLISSTSRTRTLRAMISLFLKRCLQHHLPDTKNGPVMVSYLRIPTHWENQRIYPNQNKPCRTYAILDCPHRHQGLSRNPLLS